MSQDIKCQLIDTDKRGKYALQLDESTNVSGLAQLIVFVRYIATVSKLRLADLSFAALLTKQ